MHSSTLTSTANDAYGKYNLKNDSFQCGSGPEMVLYVVFLLMFSSRIKIAFLGFSDTIYIIDGLPYIFFGRNNFQF